MDRRSFLKSTSLVAGGIALNSLFNQAIAQTNNINIPSEKQPLLLNFNENSLGMSPSAKEAIIKALPNAFRYPDDARAELQVYLISTLVWVMDHLKRFKLLSLCWQIKQTNSVKKFN